MSVTIEPGMSEAKRVAALLNREIVEVVGCTEPASCAYAFRTLARHWPAPLDLPTVRAHLWVSRDVYRNASTAVVPFLHQRGVRAAVAAGLTTSAAGFNVFPRMNVAAARALLRRRGWLEVQPLRKRGIWVRAELIQDAHRGEVLIADRHDRVARLVVDGREIKLKNPAPITPPGLDAIVRLARRRMPALETIAEDFLLKQAEGTRRLSLEKRVARLVRERMCGHRHAIMTITGSGNHGIFLGLPLRELYREQGRSVLPAVLLALLVQLRLSQERSRISDDCGLAIKAAPALAAGLAFARGATLPQIRGVIRSVTRKLRSLECQGARASCGAKAEKSLRLVMDEVNAVTAKSHD